MKPLLVLLLLAFSSLSAHASRTVTDELGRKVLLPDHPNRIICLIPSLTDTVYALGAGDQVVAISDYTKYPAAALKKPSVGDTLHPSIETILSFHPDLILGFASGGPNELAIQAARLNIPVYFVNPLGIAGLLHSVLSVGDALNRPNEAATLVASLEQRIARVKIAAATRPHLSVFLPIWYDPLMSIGKNAFITELIETAGVHSITDDIAADWPQVSMESILADAPQALVLYRDGKMTLAQLKTRPGWQGIPAVQQGRVLYIDSRIELASPIAIDALEDFARQLQP